VGTLWFVGQLWAPRGPAWPGWVLALVSGCCGTLASWRVGHVPGTNAAIRRFWSGVALAVGILTLAVAGHARDAVLGPDAPTQHTSPPTVVLYVTGVLVMVWTLLRSPGMTDHIRADPPRFWLDTSIVLITTALFTWQLSFRHVEAWRTTAGSAESAFVAVLLGAVGGLAFTKIALTGVGPISGRSLLLMTAAAVVGVSEGALAPLLAAQPRLSFTQLGFPVVGLAMTAAADHQLRAARRPRTTARVRRRRFGVVPYLAVAATDGLLLTVTRENGREAVVVAVSVVALTAAVVARQVIALRENARLIDRLDLSMVELHQAQDRLSHQATHDTLTGLTNRYLFEDRVAQSLTSSEPVILAFVDLDDFKIINDRYGHLVGDAVLRTVARRLSACAGPRDVVARLGGDEFALLLHPATPDDGRRRVDEVVGALDRSIHAEGHDLMIRSSIGLAESWVGAETTELLRRADLAMYAAKESGKARVCDYDPTLEARATDTARIAAGLRAALDRDEFHLVFQPVVTLPDGATVVGVEALLRWHHPDQGVLSPAGFIPVAERTGVITGIGSWVLREACHQAARWLRAQEPARWWRIGVNISARQLDEPGFSVRVADVLVESGLPADRLMIEVTETAVFDNDRAVEELLAVSRLGVTVALDDFGTGHSSLALLRTVPVDVLKVDRSFVEDITRGTAEAVITTALIQITEGLGLTAVAEGVETSDQADHLHRIGYHLAQGFLFARPLDAGTTGELLATRTAVSPPRTTVTDRLLTSW
jgi:diguanylate cyclase (GGDEF)-like protein